MLEILRHTSFRRIFLAQIVALVGTGLATVALALLAYDLAGADAGAVLGTALAIKMTVYVLVSPVAAALIPRTRRKQVLIALDLVRAGVALSLPFVDAIWQIYVLIALLQSASACFTPLFQSLIPEILTEERDYTRALSLSRLAYDLESLLSPMLAAALLLVISFHGLFAGTAMGFVVSALLVLGTRLPTPTSPAVQEGPFGRARRGLRIYLQTPRLRGLLALNLCAAAGGAMVFVNTVVVVRDALGAGEQAVAWVLAAFGGGSMLVAFLLPRWLESISDRRVMLTSALAMTVALVVAAISWRLGDGRIGWILVIAVWIAMGMAYAGLVTPGGRLLRRSALPDDLPSLFAAQFSLSHACWLLAYPLAGWLGRLWGLGSAWIALALLAAFGLVAAWRMWPTDDAEVVEHHHAELPADHPHMLEHTWEGRHRHAYRIDVLHRCWPG